MGYQLGVVQRYMACEIQEEYAKFAESVRLITELVKNNYVTMESTQVTLSSFRAFWFCMDF